jgi:hypothetical protein
MDRADAIAFKNFRQLRTGGRPKSPRVNGDRRHRVLRLCDHALRCFDPAGVQQRDVCAEFAGHLDLAKRTGRVIDFE